jgi:hypothetical protein
VEEAERALREGKAAFSLVPAGSERLPSGYAPPRTIACLGGFNINGGRTLKLQLMTSRPPEELAACPVPASYRCGGAAAGG